MAPEGISELGSHRRYSHLALALLCPRVMWVEHRLACGAQSWHTCPCCILACGGAAYPLPAPPMCSEWCCGFGCSASLWMHFLPKVSVCNIHNGESLMGMNWSWAVVHSLGSGGWFSSCPDWDNETEIKFNYVLCPFPKKEGPICLRTGTQ